MNAPLMVAVIQLLINATAKRAIRVKIAHLRNVQRIAMAMVYVKTEPAYVLLNLQVLNVSSLNAPRTALVMDIVSTANASVILISKVMIVVLKPVPITVVSMANVTLRCVNVNQDGLV
jgi:hypothetical protein